SVTVPDSRSTSGRLALQAEGEGFEPSVDRKAHNGFRDRPVQPLRHPSIAVWKRASSRTRKGSGHVRAKALRPAYRTHTMQEARFLAGPRKFGHSSPFC